MHLLCATHTLAPLGALCAQTPRALAVGQGLWGFRKFFPEVCLEFWSLPVPINARRWGGVLVPITEVPHLEENATP